MSTPPGWLTAFDKPPHYGFEVPVLNVFDGDGFLTRIPSGILTDDIHDHKLVETGVRFGFIDAPEMGQPGGPEAKEMLTRLIGDRSIWICVLTKGSTGKTVDAHRRLLAAGWVGQKYPASLFSDQLGPFQRAVLGNKDLCLTRSSELEMLLNGRAWLLEQYSPDDEYLDALEHAQSNRLGIWAWDNNVTPWDFKRRKGKRRHQPGNTGPEPAPPCPIKGCDGSLVRRYGRYGEFFGCTNHPQCRYSRSTAEP